MLPRLPGDPRTTAEAAEVYQIASLGARAASEPWECLTQKLPADIKAPVTVHVAVAPLDRLDPTKGLALQCFKSADNGRTWQFVFGCTWRGSPLKQSKGPRVGLTNGAELAGCILKVVVVPSGPLSASLALEVWI